MLWYITLSGDPSPVFTLWGNRVVCPVRSPAQAEASARLETLSLDDGRRVWQHTFTHALVSGLAVVGERLLVSLTSTDLLRGQGALLALDAGGTEVWRWSPGVQQVSAPVVVGDTAFITADATALVAVNLHTGEEQGRWSLSVSASRAAPVIAGDTVLIPCRGPHLLVLGLDGSPRWRFDAPGAVWLDQTPVVVGNRICAVTSTGQVVALDFANGALQWQTDIGPVRKPLTAPITDGERLYVGARDGLYALDPDGHEVWHFPTLRCFTAMPVVTGGVVYAACHDHHLYALDAASGKQLWQYAADRRIEVSPLIISTDLTDSTEGEKSISSVETGPLAVIADRSGTITCLERPLSALEHESAGHWAEAASAYTDLGRPARGAALLEAHAEPFEAAQLWQIAGDVVRAAAQYEVAGAWSQAADLWAVQGNAPRQAEALQRHARSLEVLGTPLENLADLWTAIARLYDTLDERALATSCRREVARCLQQPDLALEIEHDGLVHNVWTMVSFIVRNVGFGPARNLVIRATGEQFDGQVVRTRRIISLDVGERAVERLDIKPLEYGVSVPLRIALEFVDRADHPYTCAQTLHLSVLQTAPQERKTVYSRVIAAASDFVDMEVRIFRCEKEGYPVEITLGDGQNFPRGYLDADLADWSSSGDLAVDGQWLFAALTADANLRNAWSRCCGQAPRRRIRLRIDPDAPELHSLPWELLQEDGVWLSASAHTPFSRYLPGASPYGGGVEERPLRVLVAIANPSDLREHHLTSLNPTEQKIAIAAAFAGLESTAHLGYLNAPATLPRLEEALQEGVHILHIVSHGDFDAQRGHGVLYLQDGDGLTEPVSDTAFRDILKRLAVPPRLIVLSACWSAARSTTDAFLGFAPRLIAAGIPAVVAMQANVSLTSARDLCAVFYRRLMEHGTVDLALNEARSTLLTGNRPDAAVPVLFMRLKDGQLFGA